MDRSARGEAGRALASLIEGSPRTTAQRSVVGGPPVGAVSRMPVIQRVIKIGEDEFTKPGGNTTRELIEEIDSDERSELWRRGWRSHIKDMAGEGGAPYEYDDLDEFITTLAKEYEKEDDDGELSRPSFPKKAYELAKGTASVQSGKDKSDISLSDFDLAMPHRMPFSDIRSSVLLFGTGKETALDLVRWTDRLVDATEQRKRLNLKGDVKGLLPSRYKQMVEEQIEDFRDERDRVVKIWSSSKSTKDVSLLRPFLSKVNALHGNIPDLGSHSTNNIRVSDRLHSHFLSGGPMTPGTKAAYSMSPHRISKGIATTSDGRYIVTTDDHRVPVGHVKTHHGFSSTKIPSKDLRPLKLNFGDDSEDDTSDTSDDERDLSEDDTDEDDY
ncbi:hypothetical protein [Pandoraea sp. PE-S2R-1]|uniref:hypothetical protein n=1 Tax=Pandoraea sp. PE-S2R-1 TaxID=1986994 RepID=UPI000B4065DF|nr:hypothetical protein [Pandoraea sp. PE-S2R-1]